MKKFLILIASLSYAFTYTTTCIGISQALCTTAAGYCFWTGTACQMAECHKATDVRACRSSTPAGFLLSQTKCREIPNNDPNFLNQCMEHDQTAMMYAYVRFPQDITQLHSTKTTSGYLVTTIMTAKYTSQYKYEILTVNILTASTTELLNIMNAYVQMQYDLVDPEIHPQYLEKAIYESMQAIRDDVTLTLTGIHKIYQQYLYYKQKIGLLHCLMENDRCILSKIKIISTFLHIKQILNQFWIFTFQSHVYYIVIIILIYQSFLDFLQ